MASNNLRARLRSALGSGPARDELISAMGGTPFGNVFYVSGSSTTMGGGDNNEGLSADAPLATMAQVMTNIAALPTRLKSNGIIFVTGDVRGVATAPLGAYGWKIIGAAGGRPRHTTADGTVLAGNGAAWRDSAVSGAAPLLELREQGWEVYDLLFLPAAGYGGIKFHRLETATTPDASHGKVGGCRFIGSAATGYGIDDVGCASGLEIVGCEFNLLEYGIYSHGGGIAAPQRQIIEGNTFTLNKHDIMSAPFGTLVKGNYFNTPYHGTTHPNTINLANGTDNGVATNVNRVVDNHFADNAADVTIPKGYVPATGDVWRNYVMNTAAYVVTVPTS